MIKKALFISNILVFWLILGAVSAQAQQSESGPGESWGKSILSVAVRGIQSADSFLVINSSGLITGNVLSPGMVQDAVRGIYAIGVFSDVDIDVAAIGSGVNVTIVVKEYPKLRKIKISGNKKIKRSKIDEKLTLFEGRTVSPSEIKNNIERIKSMYSEKGYLLATVDVNKIPVVDNPAQTDLEFNISEGGKVKIGQITFSGNTIYIGSKLRGKMSTKQKSFFRSGNFEKDKYLEDKDKIVTFYKDNGYIDAVVLGDSIWYSNDKSQMFINIRLREGNKYYFGKVNWEGNNKFTNDQIKSCIEFKEGGIYDQKKYDESLGKISEMYYDFGYLYLQIDDKASPRGDTMDFNLKLTENNPAKVRMINIVGNTKTRENVIRRELMIMPDTIFSRPLLIRSLREVMTLNFFENVTPNMETLPNGDIDLNLEVKEKPTGQFSVGAGYSQTDKLVANIGLGVPNLLGTGQTATLNLELGKLLNSFDISYQEPWLLGTPTSISLNFYLQEHLYNSWYTEQRLGGNFQVGRRLKWPDNYFRIFSGYRLEQVDYSGISADYIAANDSNRFSVDKYKWPLSTSAVSLSIIRDSKDLPQFATKGSILSWHGEMAGMFLGGSWDYYKEFYSIEYYKTVFWKFVLMGRAKYGEISGLHGDASIPYSDRFAPGGVDPDGTIRGYDDGLVGPYDSRGAFLKGRFELIYNLELTLPISDQQFYILLFSDAGNAYRNLENIRLTKGYMRSVGVGFRVIVPYVGIMGFDFGYPFDGHEKGKWKPHFQIGRGF